MWVEEWRRRARGGKPGRARGSRPGRAGGLFCLFRCSASRHSSPLPHRPRGLFVCVLMCLERPPGSGVPLGRTSASQGPSAGAGWAAVGRSGPRGAPAVRPEGRAAGRLELTARWGPGVPRAGLRTQAGSWRPSGGRGHEGGSSCGAPDLTPPPASLSRG